MRSVGLFALSVSAAPAHAVDGAGLQASDIFGVLVILFGATLPFLIAAAVFVVALMTIRSALRRGENRASAATTLLPPAVGTVEFTDEEAELMRRFHIFFTGTQFRIGELTCETLADALAKARRAERTATEF